MASQLVSWCDADGSVDRVTVLELADASRENVIETLSAMFDVDSENVVIYGIVEA